MQEHQTTKQMQMKKKSMIRYVVLLVLVLAAAVAFYAYKEFNRKPKNLSATTADFTLQQQQLLNEFAADEKTATAKYSGKVIAVTGTVKAVETDDTGNSTVILGNSSSMSSIRCSADSLETQAVAVLKPNSSITIKGICTGYNADELGLGADIILNRCVLIKQ